MLCGRLAYYKAIVTHLYKVYVNQPAPSQCACGFVATSEEHLSRHQKDKDHQGKTSPEYEIPEGLMIRKAFQTERAQQNKSRRKRKAEKAPSFVLDYTDWDMTETTQDESWGVVAKKAKNMEDENNILKKKVEELTRINDILAADIETPNCGVPFEAALSGFEATWAEEQEWHNRPYHTNKLFPDPPQRVQSSVVVPPTNRHLSHNERVWKQSSEEAIRRYNKRHR